MFYLQGIKSLQLPKNENQHFNGQGGKAGRGLFRIRQSLMNQHQGSEFLFEGERGNIVKVETPLVEIVIANTIFGFVSKLDWILLIFFDSVRNTFSPKINQ